MNCDSCKKPNYKISIIIIKIVLILIQSNKNNSFIMHELVTIH